jgi:two-component system, NtrC family, sensor kinase
VDQVVNQATLLVIQGVDQGTRFELDQSEFGIGRGAQNGIRLHDTEISRAHAHVRWRDGRHVLTDLRSSNGTYVNGVLVESRDLTHGDEIQFGRTVLLYTQPAIRDESKLVADRVALVAEQDPQDRSSIVGAAAGDSKTLAAAIGADGPRAHMLTNLQVLYRISEEAVHPSHSIEQLLSRVLELTIEVAGADRGCILLRDVQSGELVPQVFRHRAGLKETGRMPVSRSIVDYVDRNRQGVRTSDARADARFTPGQSILQAGIREALCVPMQGRYDLQGVIYIDITTHPERVILENSPASRFTEDMLRLMIAIGRQSALAVEDNRYRQALVKAERLAAVGQTIATLSHHIKNILQGVRGGSYLIDMGLNDHNEDLVRKGWNIVEKNQTKIYDLVMDMLTFSKERQPNLRRGDVNETVAEVCELVQARADELHARLEWRPAADMPSTAYDPEGIHRAVLNVVGNALDAVDGRESGEVRVATGFDPKTGLVSVTVHDNGPGIPPEIASQIFNLFESTKGARGTGIGLSVSQKILREHGGEIHVVSQPGEGACFSLEWPIADEESPAPDRPTGASPAA